MADDCDNLCQAADNALAQCEDCQIRNQPEDDVSDENGASAARGASPLANYRSSFMKIGSFAPPPRNGPTAKRVVPQPVILRPSPLLNAQRDLELRARTKQKLRMAELLNAITGGE